MKTLISTENKDPGPAAKFGPVSESVKTILSNQRKVALRLLLGLIVCTVTSLSGLLKAQVPQGFNYQAIARNESGNPIPDQLLPVRITIQSDPAGGEIFWQEIHPDVTTNEFGLFMLEVGKGVRQPFSSADAFNTIDWTVTPKYLKTEIDYDGWTDMGSSQLWSVPYSLVAGDLDQPLNKLSVEGITPNMEEALFEVRNNAGQTVFAVYNEGVRINVDDGDAKGLKGGFAIGGLNPAKGTQELFVVSPDSIRAYIAANPGKGIKGGFAIGGFDLAKGVTSEYLGINPSLTPEIINPAEPRILWYPLKEAFLAGRILVESPDSIGTNSLSTGYESKAIGSWSQALGYKAIARGNYSTSIGRNSLSQGTSSFALGYLASARGNDSYAFGSGAKASAAGSFAIGSAGVDSAGTSVGNTIASGLGSFALGFGSVSSGEGSFSYGLGNQATGNYSMSLGYLTQADGWYATSMGHNTSSSGYYSTAMGYFSLSDGVGSTSMGCGTTASGLGSTALGWSTVVEAGTVGSLLNMGSLAAGVSTRAGNYASTAFGDRSYASGHTSFATGFTTTASGQASSTFGGNTSAEGAAAIAAGVGTVARPFASLAIGQYNVVSGSPNTWYSTDPVFIIGNGDSDAARSNAVTVFKNGTARFSGPIYANDVSSFGAFYASNAQAIWYDGTYFSWGYGGSYNVFADKVSIGTVNSPGTYSLYVAGNAYTTGTWGGSDIRWKKDIGNLENNLDKIMLLKGVSFRWRTEEFPDAGFDEGEQIGLIAQDVEKVFPELVRTDQNGYKAVAYDKLSAILIEAVKEQESKIEYTNKENQQLRLQLEILQGRIEEIEILMSEYGMK